MRRTKNEMWDGRSTLNRRGNSQAERICREGKLLSVERRSVNGQMEQEGTRGNRKGSDELLMRGLVQLVRTPYSHPEPEIMKKISTAVAARGAVEIAVNGLRMKLSVGSIESQPTGIPLLRIRTPSTRCFQAESRAGGCALFPKRTLGCGLGISKTLL